MAGETKEGNFKLPAVDLPLIPMADELEKYSAGKLVRHSFLNAKRMGVDMGVCKLAHGFYCSVFPLVEGFSLLSKLSIFQLKRVSWNPHKNHKIDFINRFYPGGINKRQHPIYRSSPFAEMNRNTRCPYQIQGQKAGGQIAGN
jgi:hypothetical protein